MAQLRQHEKQQPERHAKEGFCRPEDSGHAAAYYDSSEAHRYHNCREVEQKQLDLTMRALDFLCNGSCVSGCSVGSSGRIDGHDIADCILQPGSMVADLGCGSGLSAAAARFCASLAACLKPGAPAVLQLYPRHAADAQALAAAATAAAMSPLLLVDLPHFTVARKTFLLLRAPPSLSSEQQQQYPRPVPPDCPLGWPIDVVRVDDEAGGVAAGKAATASGVDVSWWRLLTDDTFPPHRVCRLLQQVLTRQSVADSLQGQQQQQQ
eukprot:gene982-1309_t